jgi:hypothetical protein
MVASTKLPPAVDHSNRESAAALARNVARQPLEMHFVRDGVDPEAIDSFKPRHAGAKRIVRAIRHTFMSLFSV